MPTAIRWYDSSDVALGTIIPSGEAGGGGGSAIEIRAYNNKDSTVIPSGADEAVNCQLRGLFRDPGSPPGPYVAEGKEYADRGYLEARVVSGLAGLTVSPSAWFKLGGSRYLQLPNIPDTQGVKLEVRLNPPADALIDDTDVRLSIEYETGRPIAPGHSGAAFDGVVLPLRDVSAQELITASDPVESGTPDGEVQVPDLEWIGDGLPRGLAAHAETMTAAASGKEKWTLLSLDGDGTMNQTDGAEVTAPADDGDKPAVPDGDIPICYVRVGASPLSIEDGDIDQVWSRSFYAFSSSTLNATIARGPAAAVHDQLAINSVPTVVPLTASTTNYIWLLRDGTLQKTTDGNPPSGESRAVLLWEATTDSSSVTATVDRRPLVGLETGFLLFQWLGTLATADYRYAVAPARRDSLLFPQTIVVSVITNNGSGGATEFQLEYWDGAAWQPVFDSSNRPQIAYDAGNNLSAIGGVMTKGIIPAGAPLRASLAAIPSGTAPTDATMIVPLAP